jgi:membrane protease YdiL (CAAX protease family)
MRIQQDNLWVYTILPVVLLGVVGMLVYGAYYGLQATRPELVAGIAQGQLELWMSVYFVLVRWLLAFSVIRKLGWATTTEMIAPRGNPWRFRPLPAVLVFLAMNALTAVFLLGLTQFVYTTMFAGLPLWGRLGLVAVTSITAGFCEELIWRGYVITRLEARGRSRWPAIALAAVAFALIHGSPFHWVYTFVIGLIAGFYYTRERTLVPLMITHVVLDLWGFGVFVV